MPTGIWSSRLRSGSAHCDLRLAVEVRQCPLGSGARGGGPAVPTGIWTARRRRRVRRRRRQWRRRRRRTALIKSNNPHLAAGEKRTKNTEKKTEKNNGKKHGTKIGKKNGKNTDKKRKKTVKKKQKNREKKQKKKYQKRSAIFILGGFYYFVPGVGDLYFGGFF